MIFNTHSDVSYISERNSKSRAPGHFFFGWIPRGGERIQLNGTVYRLCSILKFVELSVTEAELGSLSLNKKESCIMQLTLAKLVHTYPPTPINCYNSTVAGIANVNVKKKRSRSMELRYFYVCDQVNHGFVDVLWHPCQENLGYYTRKHQDTPHNKLVRP